MQEPNALKQRLNLQGEFLGVTSLACYSAPWFLQVPLLLVIAAMFFAKVADNSKTARQELEHLAHAEQDEDEDDALTMLQDFNRLFFGFTVSKKNQASYWGGFLLFLITFVFAVIQTAIRLLAMFG